MRLYRVFDRVPPKLKHGWTAFWLFWAASGIIAELLAWKKADGRGDTLSVQIWTLTAALPQPLRVVFGGGIAVFLGWLLPHFVLGWW